MERACKDLGGEIGSIARNIFVRVRPTITDTRIVMKRLSFKDQLLKIDSLIIGQALSDIMPFEDHFNGNQDES